MSNYLTNFYDEYSNVQTLLTETDHTNFQPCKNSFIYGSGGSNISLGIPMDEIQQDCIRRVLPCSCLIYSINGKTPKNYTNYDELCGGINSDEFVEDISCGERGSAFLTSKGRVFTSGNSISHDASKIPSFACGDPQEQLTNEGMVVELNLENVREKEKKCINNQQEEYIFGIKQVCVLSSEVCIVTKIGLVWILTKKDGWMLLEFRNKNDELARIKYVTSGLQHLMALSEDGELFSASQNDDYGACGAGSIPFKSKFEVNQSVIQLQSGDSILDVYAAYYRTLIVTKLGKLYVSGWGMFYQHSLGHENDIFSFTLHKPMEETGEKIIKVALGGLHAICLCESGNCWALGYSAYKQSGIESAGEYHTFPILIPVSKKIKDIFCGWHFSILQTVDGEFLGAGSNVTGELSSIPRNNDGTTSIVRFTPLQLPKPPFHDTSQIMWRIYTCSFATNIFYMGRLVLNKRTQWMKQNLKTLSKNPLLSDITVIQSN